MVSFAMAVRIVVLVVLQVVSVSQRSANAEIASNRPLVYHSWPPIGGGRAPSLSAPTSASSAHQHQHHHHHHPHPHHPAHHYRQHHYQHHQQPITSLHHHQHHPTTAASSPSQLVYQPSMRHVVRYVASPAAASSSSATAPLLQPAPSNTAAVYAGHSGGGAAGVQPKLRPAAAASSPIRYAVGSMKIVQQQPHYTMTSARPSPMLGSVGGHGHSLHYPFGVSAASQQHQQQQAQYGSQGGAAITVVKQRQPASASSSPSSASSSSGAAIKTVTFVSKPLQIHHYPAKSSPAKQQQHYASGGSSASSKKTASSSSSSSSVQPVVDYVFEKPLFGLHQLQQLQKDAAAAAPTIGSDGSVQATAPTAAEASPTSKSPYNPIHTIRAPNLSAGSGGGDGGGGALLTDPKQPYGGLLNVPLLGDPSNHLFEKDTMFPVHLAFSADRPTSIAQYQVTEPTIDQHALRTVSAALFAPDMNAAAQQQQQQQHHHYTAEPLNNGPGSQPAASALVAHQLHFAPHHQSSAASAAAATYAAHLRNNQQMLVPSAQALLSGGSGSVVPMAAVYNPTYLVQQSNQLFDTHKQHLFRPERQYLHLHQPQLQLPSAAQQQQQQQQPPHHLRPADQRSPAASASPLIADLIETEFLPSFQLPSGAYAPLTGDGLQQPHRSTLAPQQRYPIAHQHQSTPPEAAAAADPAATSLTVEEVANLLNFGSLRQPPAQHIQQTAQNVAGFVASHFYAAQPPPFNQAGYADATDAVFRHQQRNEERIAEATAARQQQLGAVTGSPASVTARPAADATIFVTRSPEQRASEAEAESAHQRHQQRLAEQLQTDMRIYVPDEDYASGAEQSDTFHKRSDNFGDDQRDAEEPPASTKLQPIETTTMPTAAEVTALKPVHEEVNESALEATTVPPATTTVPTAIDTRTNAIVVAEEDEAKEAEQNSTANTVVV